MAAQRKGKKAAGSSRFGRPDNQRRAKQLCRQVFETLTFALGGECGDERLGELELLEVLPWYDEGTLRAKLRAPAGTTTEGLAEYAAMLAEAQPAIREEVAEAMTRRRVPQILLVLEDPERTADPA